MPDFTDLFGILHDITREDDPIFKAVVNQAVVSLPANIDDSPVATPYAVIDVPFTTRTQVVPIRRHPRDTPPTQEVSSHPISENLARVRMYGDTVAQVQAALDAVEDALVNAEYLIGTRAPIPITSDDSPCIYAESLEITWFDQRSR